MPLARNAFRIRAADTPILNAALFLHLYSPEFLYNVQRDDLLAPTVTLVSGSPGSGKSSFLRLFETETLLTLFLNREQSNYRATVERLRELDLIGDAGPRCFGIYLQCDSSILDVANTYDRHQTKLHLFNTMLDTRIVGGFAVGLMKLADHGVIQSNGADIVLEPLPPSETPPALLARAHRVGDLIRECQEIENAFSVLLNRFPDDPIPKSIQPHVRLHALNYVAWQCERLPCLRELTPLVMLDDVQVLNVDQRAHLMLEMLRRCAVPRWLAARSEIQPLESLLPLAGQIEGRDFQRIDLDERFSAPAPFRRFAANVAGLRLQQTNSLQHMTIEDFSSQLRQEEAIGKEQVERFETAVMDRLKPFEHGQTFLDVQARMRLAKESLSPRFSDLVDIQRTMIRLERRWDEGSLFPDFALNDGAEDSKLDGAARLFAARYARAAYYSGFETIIEASSQNIEQFLSIASAVADRIIFKRELGRSTEIGPMEQERILCEISQKYLDGIERKFRRGRAIKQFVENMGLLCRIVTYQPNAPIAPGVTGFGLSERDVQRLVSTGGTDRESNSILTDLRDLLQSAVAGNVLFVRLVKQGSAGSKNYVFDFNRLLCIAFKLPLGYGGWRHVRTDLLFRMTASPIAETEMWEQLRKRAPGENEIPLGEQR